MATSGGEAAQINHRAAERSIHHNQIAAPTRLSAMDWMQHLQWPAMVATLLSAWLVAAQSKKWRQWGFWLFLLSNVLWVAWGWKTHAYALVILQFGLVALNIRGVAKNERA
jgi:hypothetical protein